MKILVKANKIKQKELFILFPASIFRVLDHENAVNEFYTIFTFYGTIRKLLWYIQIL